MQGWVTISFDVVFWEEDGFLPICDFSKCDYLEEELAVVEDL